MKNVVLIYGGKSGEHEVSLRSAAAVFSNINRNKYRIKCIGISKEGIWYKIPETAVKEQVDQGKSLRIIPEPANIVSGVPGKGLFCGEKKIKADIIFPVLHGSFGEDGTIQGFCELIDLPYTGSGVLGSSLAMDKEMTKRVWSEAMLPVVPYQVLQREDISDPDFSLEAFITLLHEDIGFPLFVKPARTGSSVGVVKVQVPEDFHSALEESFQYDTKVLIEKGIDGREIECSVIGNTSLRAFLPGEIIPGHDFYDYSAKYIDENGAALVIPAELDEEIGCQVQETAKKAYATVCAEGFARVDLFVEKTTGRIYLNEINTIPGFTEISMFPKLCEISGLSFTRLLDALLDFALSRYEVRKKLKYSFNSTSD